MAEESYLGSYKDVKKLEGFAQQVLKAIAALGPAASAEQALPRLQAEEAEWKDLAATAKQEYEANKALNQAEAAKYEEAKQANDEGVELMKQDAESRVAEIEERCAAEVRVAEERKQRAQDDANDVVLQCEERKKAALEEVEKIEAHLAKVREEAKETLGVA
jgi:hypothetical protein